MNFEELNDSLYFKASHYKFSKNPTDFDKGYVKISDWINDLCFYYIQKSKALDKGNDDEFKELLTAQKKKVQELKPSLYKKGLLKALDDIS